MGTDSRRRFPSFSQIRFGESNESWTQELELGWAWRMWRAQLARVLSREEITGGTPVPLTDVACYILIRMKSVLPIFLSMFLGSSIVSLAQSPEFNEPWKDPKIAIAIDPYEGNPIDWEALATDGRVVAIIHRATIGDRVDTKYAERKIEAKRRGYKWGAYHFGKPGDPIKQADFFLEIVKPAPDDLIALDLDGTDPAKHMSFEEARVFIKRIREKTGRYPFVYANNLVAKAIRDQYGEDDVFAKTHLWYARFKKTVTDFPSGTWKTYTIWQFSSELNCAPENRSACLYTVPGTEYDMDVDVFNGTIEELRSKWPFDLPTKVSEARP